MLSGGDGVRSWCVHDDHASLHGRLQIDVVDADPRPSYDPKPVSGCDDVGRRVDAAADDQTVVAWDPIRQPTRSQALDNIEIDIWVGFEKLDGFER